MVLTHTQIRVLWVHHLQIISFYAMFTHFLWLLWTVAKSMSLDGFQLHPSKVVQDFATIDSTILNILIVDCTHTTCPYSVQLLTES